MTVRLHYLLAAGVGMWIAHTLPAQEPARLDVDNGPVLLPRTDVSVNQRIANTIAEQLRHSGQLRQYAIDIRFQNGTALLTGSVAEQGQREEVLRLVQGVPGVERVLDHLTLARPTVTQTQAEAPEPLKAPTPTAPRGVLPPINGLAGDPMPLVQSPLGGPNTGNPPPMPPYAWPTFAPYNNYSRVAYPLCYPGNAFPFIGPVYPFPKVPLGWRSIKLEWEDGHWWYSKYATSHDWWRLRYW